MSQFYGTLSGQAKTMATRRGGKNSGIITHAAGWRGAIRVEVYEDSDGRDAYRVYLTPWQNSGGRTRELDSGLLDAQVQS